MSSFYNETKHKRQVTMFSYPRSGSNWVSYCIERITGLVVIGSDGNIGNNSVLNRLRQDTNAVVHKVHGGNTIINSFPTTIEEGMLLVIRNYKESILRDAPNKNIEDMKPALVGLSNGSDTPDYLAMLQLYDNYVGPKILIDYDDLILEPKKELHKLTEWLTNFGGVNNLENFMDKFEEHKKTSIERYKRIHGTTATDGDPKKLKIQKDTWLTSDTEKTIDEYVESQDPSVYEKYLKRYKV